jgi:hypothetical protein
MLSAKKLGGQSSLIVGGLRAFPVGGANGQKIISTGSRPRASASCCAPAMPSL